MVTGTWPPPKQYKDIIDRLTDSERQELKDLQEISVNLGASDPEIRQRIHDLIDKKDNARSWNYPKSWYK